MVTHQQPISARQISTLYVFCIKKKKFDTNARLQKMLSPENNICIVNGTAINQNLQVIDDQSKNVKTSKFLLLGADYDF